MNGAGYSKEYRILIVKTLADWNGWYCFGCGKMLSEETATIDHIVPVSVGGKTIWSNLSLLCKDCNRRKGNITLYK